MSNFVRNNKLFWTVKVIAALFNAPATWHVFTEQFRTGGRSEFEIYFSTVMAILLIDAFFLAVLYFIESHELSVREKLPYAITSVGLAAAMLAIGYEDEGGLAFAPRLGFLGLILADLLSYLTEAWTTYFSREVVEQRIRNRQVLTRRRAMQQAYSKAIKELQAEFIDTQIKRERATLNIKESDPPARILTDKNPREIEEGIFLLADGKSYGWKNGGDELYDTTATGKPYSLVGARRARARSLAT
jgi:hypothetical protein